jgi:hypothetical protein
MSGFVIELVAPGTEFGGALNLSIWGNASWCKAAFLAPRGSPGLAGRLLVN